jgi:3-carboxy-cis,cis-muconate cycloisomerase
LPPFDALFVPADLRAAVSDDAWVGAMVEAERALAAVEERLGIVPKGTAAAIDAAGPFDPEELAEDGRRVGNPAEPLVRRLPEHAHHGATSQDIVDTAAMLVARNALDLIGAELRGLQRACAALAERYRDTVMAGRTLLQQATPITFGLKAAQWLMAAITAERGLQTSLPAQLGGASGTLAVFGDRGPEILEAYARELGLDAPILPWHTNRVPIARIGAALAIAAGAIAKIATDVALLTQTEIAEVREPAEGGSSTMPHKRNPVGSTLARACATDAIAAAQLLLRGVHEHERATGAWQAEWRALSDALALTGGAAAWMRETLEGLEVDAERMRANISDDTLSEARRLEIDAESPEDYLGAAGAFVDRALELFRSAYGA